MIVAFLDLLGFSKLLEKDEQTAVDNLVSFNNVIKTRIIDDFTNSVQNDAENQDSKRFAQNCSVSSFENLISVSDSLIIGSNNYELFISQLSNLIATIYIEYSEPFKKSFNDISEVSSNRIYSATYTGEIIAHRAFPLLFRGGISLGENVSFFENFHILNSNCKKTSLNIVGGTYLKAVKLEKCGKGPRIFCDSSVVNHISNKNVFKCIDKEKDVFELVWTIEACEVLERFENCWDNVTASISRKMLPAAINLYKYYFNCDKLKSCYTELLTLVCEGIIKYAHDKCGRKDDAIRLIQSQLDKADIDFTIDVDILNDFLR